MEKDPGKKLGKERDASLSKGIEILADGKILLTLEARGWSSSDWMSSLGNSVDFKPKAKKYLNHLDDHNYSTYHKGQQVSVLLIPSEDKTDTVSDIVNRNLAFPEDDLEVGSEVIFMILNQLSLEDFKTLGIQRIFLYMSGSPVDVYDSESEKDSNEEARPNDNPFGLTSVRFRIDIESNILEVYAYTSDINGEFEEAIFHYDRVAILAII